MSLFSPQPEMARFARRHVVLLVFITMVFVFFAGRLYYLQVSHGHEYVALSQANFVDVRREVALRGMIFDRTGQLLVDNRPSFNLYFTAAYCKKQAFESTLDRITEYVGLSVIEVDDTREYFQNTKRLNRWLPILVRRNMTWSELAAVEQHMDLLEGVEVRPETRRAYIQGPLLAHLLGYVGEISPRELVKYKGIGYRQGDIIGKSGLEKYWEEELRGKNGKIQVVVDSKKQRVPDLLAKQVLESISRVSDSGDELIPLLYDRLRAISQQKPGGLESAIGLVQRTLDGIDQIKPAIPGNNLILSLDARLQALAEKRFPGLEGAVVALDPQTGFILAMVSKPAFDPNLVSGRISARLWNELIKDPDRPLTNRAIQQHYPPGSTFKPFTGLAALESEEIDENTKQLCTGRMHFGGHVFRCWRRGGHGNVSIHRAIVQSCDVFFYRAGYKAGQDRLAQMSWSFGFGSTTGFDAGEETPGIMPDRAWYKKHTRTGYLPGFVISNSIGQGDVNVTPLQLALGYAALANGGNLMKPQLVKRIESPTGEVIRTFAPVVRQKVAASPKNLELMVAALEGVVNEPGGTAYYRRPRKVQFQAAGKTGTAQVVKQGEDRGKDLPYDFRDHAWFAAWAPLDNPKIVVAVVNEHGGHGSSGAAPVAMELITYFLEKLEKDSLQAKVTNP
ncbi:MAG: penicillin-binding protein 2 [Deltaproteobacteria bacterium]|nr:penicillin-binding protein 2 [Deltaproteobacteria bacterium]